ncbi:glucokinase [Bacillus pakistanensis]|uniref:Glucokinase n=1 Tax=Rossellomorea pakistanensis TaxID=992288 RepID=A0ABS2N7R0_9BACI|nr:ROK family transcriptional regulator [Bacillus pakistanensis]MBM7583646.1 glucokinase [Bacillus pakistanensis]
MEFSKRGTPGELKVQNMKLLLKHIRENAPVSRAELSDQCSISKPTVSNLVEELLNEGWIMEKQSKEASILGGRKPVYLYFNHHAAYAVGVDIGGTNTMMVLTDLSGMILAETTFPTQIHLNERLLDKIDYSLASLLRETGVPTEKILGVGIGAPGMTDVKNGVVIDAPSLGWINYPLKAEAEMKLKLPVYLDNDVNVAVLGESWLGAAKGKNTILLVSIGTGVGSGIMIDGKLYRGNSFAAGEIGFMVTDSQTMLETNDSFKGYGFLDRRVGGQGIVKRMMKIAEPYKEHPYANSPPSVKEIFEDAMQGDELALSCVEDVILQLGIGLSNAISLLNPEVVLLGGGISNSGHWFLPRVEEIVKSLTPVQADIKLATLGDRGGVLGAVSLLLNEHESILKM